MKILKSIYQEYIEAYPPSERELLHNRMQKLLEKGERLQYTQCLQLIDNAIDYGVKLEASFPARPQRPRFMIRKQTIVAFCENLEAWIASLETEYKRLEELVEIARTKYYANLLRGKTPEEVEKMVMDARFGHEIADAYGRPLSYEAFVKVKKDRELLEKFKRVDIIKDPLMKSMFD